MKQAIADNAYEIQKQEQRKVLGVKDVDANIARTEREVLYAEQQAEVKERILTAEVRKKADAEKYEREKLVKKRQSFYKDFLRAQ